MVGLVESKDKKIEEEEKKRKKLEEKVKKAEREAEELKESYWHDAQENSSDLRKHNWLTSILLWFFSDIISNSIMGEIPYGLPLNATHVNMACNYLSQNVPYSLSNMKELRHLNLSHNFLYGPIVNVFTDLDNLKEIRTSL